MIEAVVNQSVVDAVSAAFLQSRAYADHWNLYMNPEQRAAFSNSLRFFVRCCEERKNWLAG